MFPIILSCIVVSLIIGKTAGLFLATHIYSTQNKTVILLNSIRKIVRSWEDGLFEGKEREYSSISFARRTYPIRPAPVFGIFYSRRI